MIGSKLSKAVAKHIQDAYNGYVINIVVASKNGNSDLVCCIQGKFFAFEIKGESDTEKRLQDDKLNAVAKSGGYGGYVRSVSDVDYIVENLIQPSIESKNVKVSL